MIRAKGRGPSQARIEGTPQAPDAPLLSAAVQQFKSSRNPSKAYHVTFGRAGHLECTCGTRVSPSTVSDLNKKIYETSKPGAIGRSKASTPTCIWTASCSSAAGREIRNVSLVVAIGVNNEAYREILGICEGAKEDEARWSAFLKHLKKPGLAGSG